VVARFLTNTILMDGNFEVVMACVWNLRAEGRITTIAKNTYLVEAETEEEIYTLVDKGVWLYKRNTVALRLPSRSEDLAPEFMGEMEAWMQLHHVSLAVFNHEGLALLAG
jgi:Domain of unknown function (DUF4283)